MTPEQFTYWLQGYTEISGDQPSKEQWQVIKDHLKTVSHKVTPTYTYTPPTNYPPTPWNGQTGPTPGNGQTGPTPGNGQTGPTPWNNPSTTIC